MTNALQSRITRHEEVDPRELTANPENWRTHPPEQRAALMQILDDVGWVQDVIVNETTGHVLDGHLRVEIAVEREEATVPVVYVELTPDEERLLLATLDPITGMAGADPELLANLLNQVVIPAAPLQDLLQGIIDAGTSAIEAVLPEPYTQKVESPIYEPTGDQPELSELVDRTVADRLIDEIKQAGLPGEVEAFLLDAAERHVAFRFDRIAEYYAHAAAPVQELMEQSALVIVDFDKAIASGFVHLNDDIEAAFRGDHPDA